MSFLSIDYSSISEVAKIYPKIEPVLNSANLILDVGCGKNKVCPKAIGIDIIEKEEENYYICDLNDIPVRPEFPTNVDIIVCSFCLCELESPIDSLSGLLRILKIGGLMIVFEPHPCYVPRYGLYKEISSKFKHFFTPADLIDMFTLLSGVDILDIDIARVDKGEDLYNLKEDPYGSFLVVRRAT